MRLEDVADVVLGADTYDEDVRMSGKKAVFMGVWVLPNANTLDVIGRVRKEVDIIKRELPTGMEALVAFDSTSYIENAINEVVKTLTDDQIRSIREGKAVAKIMDAPTADQVFVSGAVYINASPESYLKLASDIEALRKLPNYLAIRKFSDPPQLSDLNGFTLDPDDFKELENCKEGHCEVQLPTEAMEEL